MRLVNRKSRRKDITIDFSVRPLKKYLFRDILALLFARTQSYLSKQPFRSYYHGVLLPVSP